MTAASAPHNGTPPIAERAPRDRGERVDEHIRRHRGRGVHQGRRDVDAEDRGDACEPLPRGHGRAQRGQTQPQLGDRNGRQGDKHREPDRAAPDERNRRGQVFGGAGDDVAVVPDERRDRAQREEDERDRPAQLHTLDPSAGTTAPGIRSSGGQHQEAFRRTETARAASCAARRLGIRRSARRGVHPRIRVQPSRCRVRARMGGGSRALRGDPRAPGFVGHRRGRAGHREGHRAVGAQPGVRPGHHAGHHLRSPARRREDQRASHQARHRRPRLRRVDGGVRRCGHAGEAQGRRCGVPHGDQAARRGSRRDVEGARPDPHRPGRPDVSCDRTRSSWPGCGRQRRCAPCRKPRRAG